MDAGASHMAVLIRDILNYGARLGPRITHPPPISSGATGVSNNPGRGRSHRAAAVGVIGSSDRGAGLGHPLSA